MILQQESFDLSVIEEDEERAQRKKKEMKKALAKQREEETKKLKEAKEKPSRKGIKPAVSEKS